MKPINILHIEDNSIDAGMVASELERANILFRHNIVDTKEGFLNALNHDMPDIVLSNHSLPDIDSLEALNIIKQKGLHVPFILIAANTSEEFAVSAIKKGADDYILKDRMQRLPSALLNAINKLDFHISKIRIEKEQKDSERLAIGEINKLARRLQLATRIAGMGVWEYDLLSNHLEWDEGMYLLYNIKQRQLESIHKTWLTRLHPNDKEQVNKEIEWAVASKKEYDTEFRIIWDDGSLHYIKAIGMVERDNAGNALKLIGINWDITNQKKEEERLKLLESVVTNTNDSVLITEAEPFDAPDPKIVYVNEAFTRMTGYTADEVIGQTPRILQGPKSDRQELAKLKTSLKKWEPCEITTINYKKNGEEFWVNFSVSPVANEKGWFNHWIAIQRDVTESKLAEIRLNELNESLQKHATELAISNANLEQHIKVVEEQNKKFKDIGWTQSHIVRAPLARMMGIASLIKNLKMADAECEELLNHFNASANELDDIIKEVVEKARQAIFN